MLCDEAADDEEGMEEQSPSKRPSVLTIDRAAFLLLRVKRAFKKKRQQRKEKNAAAAAAAAAESLGGAGPRRRPPPLLRSRTLPAIIVPGFSILHAQIDPTRNNDVSQSQLLSRGLSTHKVGGLRVHAPRISFTSKDDVEGGDARRKSASSRLSCSPRSSIASDDRSDGSILRVPGTTPRGSVSSTGSGSSRLSRLLNQTARSTPQEGQDSTRRLSWERGDSTGQLPRSASIDSLVEAVLSSRRSVPACTPLAIPSARADRALSLVSPAVGRRAKIQRGQAERVFLGEWTLCLTLLITVLQHFTTGVWTFQNMGSGDFGLTLATLAGRVNVTAYRPCHGLQASYPRAMETLLDKFKKDHGGLRRTRSVRASLRMIGHRWRSVKDENEDLELLKRNTLLFSSQIWKTTEIETKIEGVYGKSSPTMAKRKHETKQRRKSGDVELVMKPQKVSKAEKSKLSDLFSNKKYKSYSAKELNIPNEVPPKAAAILHIHSPGKDKKKTKGMGKSESTKSMSDLVVPQRQRRGSESDMRVMEPKGCVNHAFVYSTPPKDRRIPNSPSRYMKLQYGALLEGCGGDRGSLTACSPHPPEKLRRRGREEGPPPSDNIHLHALFAAVEHGHIDKARNILESTDVDVNSQNSDRLTPLDVAVLANNRQLAKVLMEFGAKEGTQFSNAEELGVHLRRLAREAEARLLEVTGCASEKTCRDDVTRSSATGAGGTTGCAGSATSEKDKQAQHWERRVRSLKRLVLGWQQTIPPGPPAPPELAVCGSHAVCVTIAHTHSHHLDPITTKYRVEWSSRADFSNICGRREVCGSPGPTEVVLSGLSRGRRYFVRASAGNLKGYGPTTVSRPRSVVPSCWRDLPSSVSRPGSAASALDSLWSEVTALRTRPAPRSRKDKKATIKQLFTPAIKFHKHLRRGVYLACVVYQDDKILVTNEDCLPVVEVDETYPTCIYADFHWLMKVSCSWEEVKNLRRDMEKHSSSSMHFRLKLLTAVAQMQTALCQQDLGTVYHKPLRDSEGTVVISCVTTCAGGRAPAACRWSPASRLRRRGLTHHHCATDLLLAHLHQHLQYHQSSQRVLPRGLYVGYLKLQSSVEVVRVVTPAATPNVPPHVKLRDNPHVSAEEWDYLKSQTSVVSTETNASGVHSDKTPSESQELFLDCLSKAARKLFKDMDIPLESAVNHRIYDLEVIELNSNVSFIMICPPAELACSVPGQKEILLQRGDLLSLPLQAFEMIHLQTYHSSVLTKYTKLSCMLELDVTLAAHTQREAFSCSELQIAKEKLTKLEELQNNLNAIWKSERWLMDLIGFARDKDKTGPSSGVLLKYILDKMPSNIFNDRNNDKDVNLKVDLLQLPSRDGKIKSGPGRGSWPGPAGNGHQNLNTELSKSEQQLSLPPRQSNSSVDLKAQFTHSDKENIDSKVYSNQRLPPSKSEDTLVYEPEPEPENVYSTASSPLLTVKSCSGSMVSVKTRSNVTGSVQSLSSDSESQSCPINASVPLKNRLRLRPQSRHRVGQVVSSKSMVNVKSDTFYTDTGQELFGKGDDGLVEQVKTEQSNDKETASEVNKISDQPGILQVFAAYETGLAAGTSLKLHVTPRTSAREVIDLVVKQLNMAAVLKGKAGPLYGPDRLPDFCLVAVIGARERCLRDDFRPLRLQNPWRKGTLYVRLKHDVLAALTHSANRNAFI